MKHLSTIVLVMFINLLSSASAHGIKHNTIMKTSSVHRMALESKHKKELRKIRNLLSRWKLQKKLRNPNFEKMKILKENIEKELDRSECCTAVLADAKAYRKFELDLNLMTMSVSFLLVSPLSSLAIMGWDYYRYKTLPCDPGILIAEIKREIQRDFARAKYHEDLLGVTNSIFEI